MTAITSDSLTDNQSVFFTALPYTLGSLALSTGSVAVTVLTFSAKPVIIPIISAVVAVVATYGFCATLVAGYSSKNSDEFYDILNKAFFRGSSRLSQLKPVEHSIDQDKVERTMIALIENYVFSGALEPFISRTGKVHVRGSIIEACQYTNALVIQMKAVFVSEEDPSLSGMFTIIQDQEGKTEGHLEYLMNESPITLSRDLFIDIIHHPAMSYLAKEWLALYDKGEAELYIHTDESSISEDQTQNWTMQVWTFFNADSQHQVTVALGKAADGSTVFSLQPEK